MCEKTGKNSNGISQAKLNSENLTPKSFVCIHCEEKHFSEELLKQHNLIHHSKLYHCLFCPFKSPKISFLLQHVKKFANHDENTCTVCSFESESKVDLNMHLILHSSPLPFFCSFCELKFKCRSLWSKHLLGHSQRTEFSYPHCSENFKTKSLQKVHELKSQDDKKKKCDECGYSTRFPAYFKKHVSKHEGKFLHCTVLDCHFKTLHKESLKLHEMSHENSHNIVCRQCGIVFKYERNLKRHTVLYHSSQWTFKCNECNYQSERRDKLNEHLIRVHNAGDPVKTCKVGKQSVPESQNNNYEAEPGSGKCQQCSRLLESEESRKCHKSVYHSELYHCLYCDFKSSEMIGLVQHLTSVTNHNEIVCSICLFESNDPSSMMEHLLLHRSRLPFICTSCQSRSETSSEWKAHSNTHQKLGHLKDSDLQNPADSLHDLNGHAREFNRCNLCEYVTKFPSYLRRHVLKHGSNLLHCSFIDCGYTTRHPSYMRRHFRRHVKKCSPSSSKRSQSTEMNGEKLSCSECGVTFSLQKNLNRHKEVHRSRFVFACSKCLYQSARQDKVKAHWNRHHADLMPVSIIKNVITDVRKVEHESLDSCDPGPDAITLSNKDKTGNTSSSLMTGIPFALLIPLKDLETHLDESTGILSFICDISDGNESSYASQQSETKRSDNSDELAPAQDNEVSKENSSVCGNKVASGVSMLNMNESPCLQTLLDEVTGEITTLQGHSTPNSADSIDNLSDTMDFTYDIDFMNDDSFDGFDEFDDFIFESISTAGTCDSFMEKILNEETGELCLEVQSDLSSSSEIKPYWHNADQDFHSSRENVFSELFLDEVTGEFSLQS